MGLLSANYPENLNRICVPAERWAPHGRHSRDTSGQRRWWWPRLKLWSATTTPFLGMAIDYYRPFCWSLSLALWFVRSFYITIRLQHDAVTILGQNFPNSAVHNICAGLLEIHFMAFTYHIYDWLICTLYIQTHTSRNSALYTIIVILLLFKDGGRVW